MDETKNPWTVLSRSTVYENAWIRVDHHDVLNPAGGSGVYGTVHFKNHAIGIVPIDENGNVILVGQYRFPLNSYSWEIPEGGGSGTASHLESAQRELREECGLVAESWIEILKMDLSNSVTDESGTAFLAWNLANAPSQPEENRTDSGGGRYAKVPFWEAVERAKRGEIRDNISIVALLRVALMALQGELPESIAETIPAPALSGMPLRQKNLKMSLSIESAPIASNHEIKMRVRRGQRPPAVSVRSDILAQRGLHQRIPRSPQLRIRNPSSRLQGPIASETRADSAGLAPPLEEFTSNITAQRRDTSAF